MGELKIIKRKFLAAFVFVIALGLSACGSVDNDSSDTYSIQEESIPIETVNVDQGAVEQQEETKEERQDEQTSSAGEWQETQKEGAQDIEGNAADDELEEDLKGMGFVRIHQSFLINMKYIERISSYVMILTTGKEISVPKSRYPEVKRQYTLFKGK